MGLSILFIRIIFLLLPGLVGFNLYKSLTGIRKKKNWEDLTGVLLFSIASYSIYGAIIALLNIYNTDNNVQFTNIDAFFDETVEIKFLEIFLSSIISISLSIVASYFYTFKLINRFGRMINATKRFGDTDVWDFLHTTPNLEWVTVRDHKLDLIYFCYVRAYSESTERRELLLEEVSVFNLESELLYEVDAMYISRDNFELTIEVPRDEDL